MGKAGETLCGGGGSGGGLSGAVRAGARREVAASRRPISISGVCCWGRMGRLWAGSDGAGVIYRFTTWTAGAKPFAAYAAARREITALAMDAAGNVYAAGVGTKGASGAASVAGDGECGGDDYVFAAGIGDGGGDEYAGTGWVGDLRDCGGWGSEKLLTLKDDVVYALAVRNGSLLAATGIGGGCIAWIRRWRGGLRMWRIWRLRRGWRLRR